MSSLLEDLDRFRELLVDLSDPFADSRFTVDGARDYLVGIHPRLLRAELGERKLEAFRRVPRAVPSTVDELLDRVSYFGDRPLLDRVTEALQLAPACVRWFALDVCAFVGVGIDSTAWTGSLRFATSSGKRLHRVIVLGPDATVRSVLHELGHVWASAPLDDDDGLPGAISTRGEEGFIAYLAEAGDRDSYEAHRDQGERLADALAECWQEMGDARGGTP